MNFPRTIRWRLLLWLGLLLVALLGGFGFTAYQLQKVRLLGQLDEELETALATLSRELRRPPPSSAGGPPGTGFGRPFRGPPPDRPGEPPRRVRDVEISEALRDQFEAAGFHFAIWHRRGMLLESGGIEAGRLERPAATRTGGRPRARTRGEFRELHLVTPPGEVVMVGASTERALGGLRGDRIRLWAAGIGVLAVGLAGCWWITTSSLRPVREIGRAARRIAEGDLGERIAIDEPRNELGELAGVLNDTFARLDEAFAQQVRFTSDASHELRTPLALMISEAQTTLARERGAAEYRESLEHCLDSAQRMRGLVAALLELARLDADAEKTERERLDLAAVTAEHARRLEPLAREAGCRIETELHPAIVLGSEARIASIVGNLLSNAIHHNRPGGRVLVRVSAAGDEAVLEVEDDGPGIPPDALPHVFERFFRTDPSRTKSSGGAGLGLAICRSAAAAEGGAVEVRSEPGKGSVFTARLPLADCSAAVQNEGR